MESLDILILAVEASIAFAGFSGIIATFQFAGDNVTRRADVIGLNLILKCSLMTSFIASIALLLYSFNVKETTLWAICSVLSVIVHTWGIHALHRDLRGVDRTKSLGTLIVILLFPVFVMILIQVMNALDIFFHREAGPVIAGIVYQLCIAGFMFSRLLLHPVWRNVRKQEAAKLADSAVG